MAAKDSLELLLELAKEHDMGHVHRSGDKQGRDVCFCWLAFFFWPNSRHDRRRRVNDFVDAVRRLPVDPPFRDPPPDDKQDPYPAGIHILGFGEHVEEGLEGGRLHNIYVAFCTPSTLIAGSVAEMWQSRTQRHPLTGSLHDMMSPFTG